MSQLDTGSTYVRLGGVVLLAAVLAVVAVLVFARRTVAPGPAVPVETGEALVTALERGDPSALPRLVARGAEGITALEARLGDSSRGVLELLPPQNDPRDRLIAALEAFGEPAEPALVRLFGAIPAKARRLARALETIGAHSPEAIAALLDQLDEPGEEVASALAKAGPASVPGVTAALRDEKRCEGAARTLAKIGAAAVLQAALAPAEPLTTRVAAARAMGEAGDAEATGALLPLLADGEESGLVRAAAGALLRLRPADPRPLLEAARGLADPGPVFDGAEDVRSLPFLLMAAQESDAGLQRRAYEALARLGPLPAEAVPRAKAALAGPARASAAAALGNGCDDPEVPPTLLRLAREDKDAYVRVSAGEACWRLGGDAQAVIPILVAELPRKADLHYLVGSVMRNAASKALARMGAPAVPALIEALETGDDFARDQAAKALYDIGWPVHAGEARLRELAALAAESKVREQAQRLLDWLATLPQADN